MSDEAKPEGGKDAYTRDRLQMIAHMIDDQLPDGWGFALLVFPLDGAPGRTNYIGHGQRPGIINAMKEWIARAEKAATDAELFKHHKR